MCVCIPASCNCSTVAMLKTVCALCVVVRTVVVSHICVCVGGWWCRCMGGWWCRWVSYSGSVIVTVGL